MRASVKLSSLLLALTLAGCTPTVNSQSLPRQAAPVAPAPAQPAENTTPAVEAGIRVALLLPLSGPQAKLGQGLFNAAQLAVYDLADQNFALLPADTVSTPEGAAAALRQALTDGAQLVIGPVFSAEVEAIAPTARARSLPVLALSNNEAMASDGVFILGTAPGAQVDRVLGYAKSRGVTRLAALVPANAYGAAVEEAVQRGAAAYGLTLVKLSRSAPGADPAMAANTFAAELTAAGGADAVLLGEGGSRLQAGAAALRTAGITARLLGTAVWDAVGNSNDPMLAGGWYAALPVAGREQFRARYQQTYGEPAAPIATLAYDATAMAAVLARTQGRFDRARLLSPTGFAGVDGVFRFHSDGTTERGLAVYELTNSGVRVIDPAPARFAGAMN